MSIARVLKLYIGSVVFAQIDENLISNMHALRGLLLVLLLFVGWTSCLQCEGKDSCAKQPLPTVTGIYRCVIPNNTGDDILLGGKETLCCCTKVYVPKC